MRSRLPRPWPFGMLLVLACAEPPDISGGIETFANLRSTTNTLLCNCPGLLGYADSIQCDDALPPVDSGARQCMTTVLDGHEDAAKEYLTCANARYELYVQCLETNVSCEADIYNDCTADHESALASCPLMPVDVQSAFEACAD